MAYDQVTADLLRENEALKTEMERLTVARDACAEARDQANAHWMETDRLLKAAMAERDRYQTSLERMVEMGCLGADQSGKRCGDCPVCDAEDALKPAAEAVRG